MRAILHTTKGDISLDLLPESAPHAVENFVGLATGTKPWVDPVTGQQVSEPFYAGLVFHRVIAGFMIQGGCPEGTGMGGPGYTFDNEVDPALSFSQPYMLGMANAGTRGGRGTNGSQFFITVAPQPHLDGGYTVFGRVSDQASRDVVDSIATLPTDQYDRPIDDVMIEAVDIEP